MVDLDTDKILVMKIDRMMEILESRILPEFYTVPEAAELLRCGDTKIRSMLRDGSLPFVRLSQSQKGTVLIKRKDINRLIGK